MAGRNQITDKPNPNLLSDLAMASNKEKAKLAECPLSISDIASLESLSHAELVRLIKVISAARWGEVALMTKEQRLEAAELKLWHGGLTHEDINKAIPALREVMDRTVGKPAQTIAMTTKVTNELDSIPVHQLIEMRNTMAEYLRVKKEEMKIVDNLPVVSLGE